MDYGTWRKECRIREMECLEEWKKDLDYQVFWRRLVDIIVENNLKFRYRTIWNDDDDIFEWDTGLFEPIESYVDSAGHGPSAKWEIEWIELNPIFEEVFGKYAPVRRTDYTEHICKKLTSEGFEFSVIDQNIHIKCQVSPISRRMAKDCEIHKREMCYYYHWNLVIKIITEKPWKCRFKDNQKDVVTQWDNHIELVDSSVKTANYGPVAKWEVEWVEVNPVVDEVFGKYAPIRQTDYTERICEQLKLHKIRFEIVDKNVRIHANDIEYAAASRPHQLLDH